MIQIEVGNAAIKYKVIVRKSRNSSISRRVSLRHSRLHSKVIGLLLLLIKKVFF